MRNKIRLSEGQLRKVIKESVYRILNEMNVQDFDDQFNDELDDNKFNKKSAFNKFNQDFDKTLNNNRYKQYLEKERRKHFDWDFNDNLKNCR